METTPKTQMCILCKKKEAIGKTTKFYCEDCTKEEGMMKLGALQRDSKFKEVISEYQNECWVFEIVAKNNKDLFKIVQGKCPSFTKEHIGFYELKQEIIDFNNNIPKLIKAKQRLRERTKIEIKQIQEELKKTKEVLKIGNFNKKETKKIEKDIKNMINKIIDSEAELKKLEKKKK